MKPHSSDHPAIRSLAAILAVLLLAVPVTGFAQFSGSIFQQINAGTYNWNDANNWSAGIPNATNRSAQLNQDIIGNIIVNLNGAFTVGALILGDSNGSHTIEVAAGTGGVLTLESAFGQATLQKVGGGVATISAPILIKDLTLMPVAGTLNITGSVTVGGSATGQYITRTGGTANITGNFTLNGPGQEGFEDTGLNQVSGTTFIGGGTNTIANGIQVVAGTLNFGRGTGASSTTFSGADGKLTMQGGTVNFGIATTTGSPAPNNSVSIPLDKITITAGTLNLRNSTGGGTTTLSLGSTGTLTLDGGTTTFYNAAGTAGGTLSIAAGAKLVMNYTPNPIPGSTQPAPTTLNFTSTNGADHTFVSLMSTSTGTVLRSQAGNGILRIGGDGIDDVFFGSLNMASSGVNSRFIKVGTETLTLAGTVNNATSRIQVDQGTLILAKESKSGNVGVNAVGASLEVASGGLVKLGGTFDGFGSVPLANYNDQIFRNGIVTLNGTGTLDLNGFSEGFDVLLGDGVVTNSAAATLSMLYLGDNNFIIDGTSAARTFDGTLVDGAGTVGLLKSGNQTLTLTNGGNSFSGPAMVTRATLQLSNNGALSGTSGVTITRNAILLLNNTASANANRINNSAAINMERGTITLRGHQSATAITEVMGALNVNLFNNIVQINHNSSNSNTYIGGTLRMTFDSFNRNPGALVSFVETSNDAAAGFNPNPATSNSQVVFTNLPTAHLVGGNGTGANYNLLIGAFGGARGFAVATTGPITSTSHFVTVIPGANNFIRPLTDADYKTDFANTGANTLNQTITTSNLPIAPATPTSTFDDVAGILTSLTTGVTINVNANTAFNAFRFAVPSTMIIADDKRFILGGMDANAGLGTIAFDGSGMALFNAATTIYGGTLYFGSREAILRTNAVAATQVNIYSTIEGSAGLNKGGIATLNLLGENKYTGPTWLNEGELGVFTSKSLGALGPANPVLAGTAALLRLSGGINFGDGTEDGSKDLFLIGENASLNTDDRHNSWSGSVFLNPTNAAGQTGLNNVIRARGDSVLTIMGDVTAVGANAAMGLYDISPTFNGAGQGNGVIIENNLPGTGGSIVNILGKLSDRNGEAASGMGAESAEHNKLNVIIRGYTGVASPTNSDFVVNIKDTSQVNGRLDLRSGWVFVDTDWGTAGRDAFTNGALLRMHDGTNRDRSGTIAALMLTQPNTVFRGSSLQVGESNGSFSSKSVALLGGMNRSGLNVFGSDLGSLTLSSVTGNSNRNINAGAAVGNGVTTITLSTAAAINLRVGYGITGVNIPPGTTVTSINDNVITLSNPTTAAANNGTTYTFGIMPVSNVLAQSTNTANVPNASTVIPLDNISNFAVGQGVTGPGITAGTVIVAIDAGNKTITLSAPTTAANNNTGVNYSAYTANQSTLTLSTTAGLRVGMGMTAGAIPAGAYITAINGNTITLSAPIIGAIDGSANIAFPLGTVSYRSATGNASGQNKINFHTVEGLTVGTIINHANIPVGTTITHVDHALNQVTLSQNTTGTVNNVDVSVQKASNFNETRLYAAPGGVVDFRVRILDSTGFALNNGVAAISKVGRGTVNLTGSAAGGNSLDGGINLFGGTLIFDYRDQTPQDPGEEDPPPADDGTEFARDFSRISQGTANSPHQLTLAGGRLELMDADAANIVESARGTLSIRAGRSEIVALAGNGSFLTLNLGYHNPYIIDDPSGRWHWRAPDRYAGGTLHLEYANLIDPDDPDGFGGAVRVLYSQNAPLGGVFSATENTLGGGAIIPYATLKFSNPLFGEVVDFSSFFSEQQANGQTLTYFADSSGIISIGNLYDIYAQGLGPQLSGWDDAVSFIFAPGYLSDDTISHDYNTGFSGVLQSNHTNNEFRGARVIRYAGNVASNTINLGSTRLVLGTSHPSDIFLAGDPVVDGGAILISNLVNRGPKNDQNEFTQVQSNQFITGGSLTSATPSTYFSASTMLGAYATGVNHAATSTDLIIHNYNELGVFTVQSPIVNFQPGLPLNLVLSGPGVTKLAPTSTSTFTGATYVSDGTLWLASPGALGQSSGAMIYLNGGTLEWASLNEANKATEAIFPAMANGRPLVLGGDGGIIKTTAPGTVLTFSGIIRSEENLIPLQLAEHRMTENIAVGDLLKTGAGRFVISNSTPHGSAGWNAYYGITEVLEGVLEVRIGNANSGILGSHYSHLDGTLIAAGARLDLQITGGPANGTSEWFDLAGGTLGTTPIHTDGSLDGVIRLSADSVFDITQGTLRLNPNTGIMEGAGKLTKTGAGTLMLFENNITYTGDIEIQNGIIHAVSQGLPLGSGSLITLGDNTVGAAGTAGILMQARNAEGLVYKAIYEVGQNIVVRAEGGVAQQTKVLGVVNTGTASVSGGAEGDRYVFLGSISLLDDIIMRYTDDAANIALNAASSNTGLRGGTRSIALSGDLSGTGSIQTEVIQNGGTVNGSDSDQIIYFELGGSNGGWTGGVRLGNRGILDNDRQHILRLVSAAATSGANRVTLDYNASLQVGGGLRTIGSLVVGDPAGIPGSNQVFVENAATSAGTLVVNQTVDGAWDAIFRNGTTPKAYFDFENAAQNAVLNLVKTGPATATMTQANTYTGFTQIGTPNGPNGGTLRLATGGSIPSSNPLTIYSGTFELAGVNHALTQPLILGGGANGTKAAVKTNGNTLTISNNVVFDATNNPSGASISGAVQMGAAQRTFNVGDSGHIGALIDLDVTASLAGTGGLLKTGPGTLALGAANTYSGGTTVSQGTLLAMNTLNSATGNGAVIVQSGAALGGVGFISGDVTLAGSIGNEAILTPGSPTISSGIELLSLNGSLTLGEFTIVDFYLGQTGWTKLFASNIASVHTSTKFRINLMAGYIPAAGDVFDIMDWAFNNSGVTDWSDYFVFAEAHSWSIDDFTQYGLIRMGDPVDFVPVSIITQPVTDKVDDTVDPGVPVTFSVGLSGSKPWMVQWQKLVDGNYQNITGATDVNYVNSFPVEEDEGFYRVQVSNYDGSGVLFSDPPIFLTVNDTPTLLSFTRTPPTGNFNPGQSVTFNVSAVNATNYEWRRNGQPVGAAPNDPTYTINSLVEADQGTYTVYVSNGAGGVETDPIGLIVNDPPVVGTHPQNRLGALGNVVTFTAAATADPAATFQWQFKPKNSANFGNISGQTGTGNSTTLQRTVSAGTEGTYRVVFTNVAGTDTSNEATLNMVGGDVNIITQPEHQVISAGSPLVLNCDATGADPLRFQWRRNGVNIAGATGRTFSVASATTARGGIYTCVVSNRNNGNGQPSSRISNEARVAVVNIAPRRVAVRQGSSSTLSISAGGPVRFQWYYDDLIDDDAEPDDDEGGGGSGDTFVPRDGAVSSTLRITNAQLSDRGHYRCRVSLMDENDQVLVFMDGGINDFYVYNQRPELLAFDEWPSQTVVSEPFGNEDDDGFIYFQVPYDQDPAKTPTAFTMRGHPTGLRIDNLGRVYGRATSVKPGGYQVTITARNLVGPCLEPVTVSLLVIPLNLNLVGAFTGGINPNTLINLDLGGRIDFKSTGKGGVSGKVLNGTVSTSFKTVLNTDVNNQGTATIKVPIKRKKNSDLILELTIDAATNRIIAGSLTDSADEDVITQVGGWRSTFVKSKDVPKPAAAVEGYYTFQLEIPAPLRHTPNTPLLPTDPKFNIPQALGFGSFTVNGVSGRTTVAFTTPDGAKGTSATFAGPLYDDDDDTVADKRELLVFRTLYGAKARGSVLGVLKINEADPSNNVTNNQANTVTGEINHWRPATPSATHRLYPLGWIAFDLTADGSRYDGPKKLGVSPPIVMDISQVFVGSNAKISFLNANVENAQPGASFVDVLVNAANKVTAVSDNQRNVKMTINEARGTLGGSFTVREPNPFPPASQQNSPRTIIRTVRWQGLIVKSTAGFRGVGQFNLNQLPTSSAEAPNRTPTLSGRVLFTKEN